MAKHSNDEVLADSNKSVSEDTREEKTEPNKGNKQVPKAPVKYVHVPESQQRIR